MGSEDSITEQQMRHYLLGELSAEETDRFEERYFTDAESFEQLQIVKADLIDHYLHRRLNRTETDRFENFFLQSPDHRREIAVLHALLNPAKLLNAPPAAVKTAPARWRLFNARPAWARLSAAALALLLIAGCAWLFNDNRRLRVELNALRVQQQTAAAREQELRQSLAAQQSQNPSPAPMPTFSPVSAVSPLSQSAPAAIFTIALAPGQSRTIGESEKHSVPGNARKIRLRLLLDQNHGYNRYTVALKNAVDQSVQTRTVLRASGDAVEVEFSAEELKSGEYTATLHGLSAKGRPEEIAEYSFSLARE